MRCVVVTFAILVTATGVASAQRWQDATASCLGTTAEWTNKIELADVDGDGQIDILAANGGDYDSAGSPETSRVWRNLGGWSGAGAHCEEISAQALGGASGLGRVIKAADIDGDGDLDLVFDGAYQTQLRLFVRDAGSWRDATSQLPQQTTSAGDVEFGDVDGDGDLDMLIGDWGATPPGSTNYVGGRTRLYSNDGAGHFSDVTAAQMPDTLVGWTWDVELADVDNDWDLDALVSCKLCGENFVFTNDGTGHFAQDASALPSLSNNYEFEPMDIDGDGDLDLMTINDGGSLRDVLLVNDGAGHFTDESAERLAGAANPMADDNVVAFLDVDADGDADILVGSLGNDRLLLNDGTGHFTLGSGATPNDTRGTLGIAVGDLDGDGRLDVVQGQGEQAFTEKVQLATAMVAVDTAPPVIARVELLGGQVVARVHDHQSPSRLHDWQRVWVEHDGGETDMRWFGEYLWRAAVAPSGSFRVCAKDRAGNQACAGPGAGGDNTGGHDDVIPPGGNGGGCCDAGGSPAGTLVLFVVVALALVLSARIRPTRRCCGSAARGR